MTAKRTDNNHAEIRDDLRKIGAFVHDCHDQGDGFPDLFVVRQDRVILLFEVKSPGKKLTPAEEKFAKDCPAPVHVVYTSEKAIQIYTGTPGRL